MSLRARLAAIALVFALAFAVRASFAAMPERLISRDGIRYARLARAIAGGDLRAALRDDYAPGYPAAAAAAGLALGARTDLDWARAALWASTLAGALTAVPAFALARRAALAADGTDERRALVAGTGAALVAALHMRHAALSADAISDALFGLLALSALAAALPGRAALSGALAAAAFLVRPEGVSVAAICFFASIAVSRERRLARAALFLLPFALLAIPYVGFMTARAGALTISQKKAPLDLLAGALARPGDWAKALGGNLARAFEVGPVAMALALAGLAFARPFPQRAAAILGAALVVLLATYALVRVDRRFAIVLTLLALPLSGLAFAAAAARSRALLAAVVAGAIAASVPVAVRSAREEKSHYLDCARAIAAAARAEGLEQPRVAAPDPRVPFYAGAALARSPDEADFLVIEIPARAPAAATEIARFPPPRGSRSRAIALYRAPPAGDAREARPDGG